MRKFIFGLLLCSLPVLLAITSIELYIRMAPNAFGLKAKSFKTQSTLDILILGSSHAQSAINPRMLSCPSANIGYGSQDLNLDWHLLEKAIVAGKKPKIVLLELSYHRLLHKNSQPYWRNGLYEYFYDLNLSPGVSFGKYVLVSSNLKFFKNFIIESLYRRRDHTNFNQWGFNENDFEGAFQNLSYDSSRIVKTAKKRLMINDWGAGNPETQDLNIKHIERIVSLCKENNIALYLFAPPVYKTYSDFFKPENIGLRANLIQSLQRQYPFVKWVNFENSTAFHAVHFKNDDHLNADGANMFTQILADSLSSIRVDCKK